MLSSDLQQQLHEYLTPAQSILVLFHDHVHADVITAALGLYLQLQAQGKNVVLVSTKHLGERWQMLPSANSVETEVANKNLQISFAYLPEAVDKVSYHIDEETQRFNLVIQPRKSFKPLDPKTVQFSQSGVEADLLITVGVHQLSDLGDVYALYADLFENTPLISINSFLTDFGTVKVATEGVSGYSELISQLLFVEYESLGNSAATNLLAGIIDVTKSFQSLNTSPDTLETAARLLRNGAQRLTLQAPAFTREPGPASGGTSSQSFADAFRKSSDQVVEAEPVEMIPKKAKVKKSPTLNPPPEFSPNLDGRG